MNNPLTTYNGYPPLGGRQGAASGTPSGAISYYGTGAVGFADADELAAIDELLAPGAVQVTAALRQKIALSAVAVPRVTARVTFNISLRTLQVSTPRVTASATMPIKPLIASTATGRVTATATLPFTIGASGTTMLRVPGTATIRFTLGLSATAEVKWSGLLSPTVTLAATWTPAPALAVPAIDVRLNSGGAVPSLYFDNDADVVVKKLPSNATPQWYLTDDPASNTPLHIDLSGVLTYDPVKRRFISTIEGERITSHLSDGQIVHLIVRWGANVRYVVKNIPVMAVRPD